MLIRLVYASKATQSVRSEIIRRILETSRVNNSTADITGVLCHADGKFLQILEGERANVNEAYFRIMQDDRHCDVVLLSYEDIGNRLYENWDMDYVSAEDRETAELIKSATGHDKFSPESFSSVEAINLTQALAKRTTPQIGLEDF